MDNIAQFDSLKTKVLKYILYKKRTEQEVRQKFMHEDENLIDDVISYLKDAGYIDDKDYVKRAINEYINLKTLSIKEISYKLSLKGINKYMILDYMNEIRESLEEYERESAMKIYSKKSKSMNTEVVTLYLNKKGYSQESIKYCIEKGKSNE